MEFKDYYKTLDISRDATAEEIKKSFRRLARKYHPDVSKEMDAESKMKEVNEAYAVLSDPEKRAAYDQLGQGGFQPGSDFQPPPGWDSGFEFSGRGFDGAQAADFSDFFAQLFGGKMGAGTRHTHHRMRGEDHHAKIMLELEDSYHGATRSLTLRMPKLDNQGRTVLAEHTLNVRIPKGVHAGQVIRLADKAARVMPEQPPVICFWKCTSIRTIVTGSKTRMSMPHCPSHRGKRHSVQWSKYRCRMA